MDDRRSTKRRRTGALVPRRRVYAPRVPRPLRAPPGVTRIKRSFMSSLICNAIATSNSWATGFKLSDLPNHTEFTALFDQYRIRMVEVKFMPVINSSNVNDKQNATLITCVDTDDASLPGFASELLQYSNHQVKPTYQAHYMKIYPRAALAVYQGAFTAYGQAPPMWFDCASPDIQFYGLKTWINNGSGLEVRYNLLFSYHIELRKVR